MRKILILTEDDFKRIDVEDGALLNYLKSGRLQEICKADIVLLKANHFIKILKNRYSEVSGTLYNINIDTILKVIDES